MVFREVKAAHPFPMEAVVRWPDHLHGTWTLPAGYGDFSIRGPLTSVVAFQPNPDTMTRRLAARDSWREERNDRLLKIDGFICDGSAGNNL